MKKKASRKWVITGYALMILSIISIFTSISLSNTPPFCFDYFGYIFLSLILGSSVIWFILSVYFIFKSKLRIHGIILLSIFIILVFFILFYTVWSPSPLSFIDAEARIAAWCTQCYASEWASSITFSDELKRFTNYIICRENKWISIPKNCADSIEFCKDFIPIS